MAFPFLLVSVPVSVVSGFTATGYRGIKSGYNTNDAFVIFIEAKCMIIET